MAVITNVKTQISHRSEPQDYRRRTQFLLGGLLALAFFTVAMFTLVALVGV